jgi:hypothetical protein
MKLTGFIAVAVFVCIGFLTACENNAPPPATQREAKRLGYFPASYTQSRSRFRDLCKQHLASPDDFCRSESIASPTDADLTVDYGFFGRGGGRLVILQSGIHGSEAVPGAAVQEMVLREYLVKLLDRHYDVLFIHALDPYGYKYFRRTDEFNVNLNRNFAEGGNYEIKNDQYERLRSLFEPAGPVRNVRLSALANEARFIGRVIADKFASQPIRYGLDYGQYRHPAGMNYGGHAPAGQVSFLRKTLTPIMARPYRQIVFLDLHTGLGKAGELAIIKGQRPPRLMDEFEHVIRLGDGDGIAFHSPYDPDFFPTAGDVIDFVPSLITHDDPRVLAVTMEYGTMGTGTIPGLRSASRMILENRAHFYPCAAKKNAPCTEINQDFQDLFSPSDIGWRLKVMREADLVFSRLLTWKR